MWHTVIYISNINLYQNMNLSPQSVLVICCMLESLDDEDEEDDNLNNTLTVTEVTLSD